MDEGLRLEGPITLTIEATEEVSPGTIVCNQEVKPGPTVPWARLVGSETIEVGRNRVLIGRSPEADIVLNHKNISSQHAGLVYLFVWQVARAIGSHLGISVRRQRREGRKILFVRSESQKGLEVEISDVIVLGRSDEADVVLDDPYASDFHMRLVAQENALMLHDLGSTNGTYVNGRRITAPTELRRGDNIQVGKTVMEVR